MRYTVSGVAGDQIALLDGAGHRYAARVLQSAPAVGVEVHGGHPVPGFAILTAPRTGQTCLVVFGPVSARTTRSE
ncbi:MAG: hypothetical protein KGN16_01125 [Burkholderiales bacterium]|nr:hypothetical protein [Burkholderiales bacterium]